MSLSTRLPLHELARGVGSRGDRLLAKSRGMFAGAALLVAVAGATGGCSSSGPPRTELTDAQLRERAAADAQDTATTYRDAVGRMMEGLWRESEAAGGAPCVVDILALSGGGDYGAFGAGFLVGWGSSADPATRRPDFDVVTGVSTGALLAPFAYVDTDESCKYVEDFYRNPKDDWIRDRGLLFFLPSNQSFMTIPGLERDIRMVMDEKRTAEMAARSRAGKLLLVSATDLDLGRQRYWDVGREAEAAAASGSRDRLQRILMASSAIPAAFPPVEIDGSLYADGGVTANVFLSLDPRTPDGLIARWKIAHPGKPFPRFRYWVIINNQLAQQPKTVQTKWPSIASASLSTSIRSATIAEVRWLAAQADWINATRYADVEVRVVAIPDDWRAPVEGTFKKETMESLSELGRRMGADPGSWRLWASPQTSVLGAAPEACAPPVPAHRQERTREVGATRSLWEARSSPSDPQSVK